MLAFILLHRFKIQFYIKLWLFYKTVAVVIHVACALRPLTFSLSNLWGWLRYEELSLLEVLEVTCQKPAMNVSSKDCTVSEGSSFSVSTRKPHGVLILRNFCTSKPEWLFHGKDLHIDVFFLAPTSFVAQWNF